MPRHRLDAFLVEGNMQIRNSIKIGARVGLLVALSTSGCAGKRPTFLKRPSDAGVPTPTAALEEPEAGSGSESGTPPSESDSTPDEKDLVPPPASPTETCGDGTLDESEDCDDGNDVPENGCSPTCLVEVGWQCTSESTGACSTICGDGITAGEEASAGGCDDGNEESGDGCSDHCGAETGYVCSGQPSACSPTCGDGQLDATEECDDGNLVDGDGCTSCVTEAGYECITINGVSSCADVDECSNNTHGCTQNASCANTMGAFTCLCDPGYSADGVECVDQDECSNDTHGCDPNASCSNTVGSFTCTCNSGYVGEGITCEREECPTNQTRAPDGDCVALPRCDSTKPFGLAFPLTQVNVPNFRESATMTSDGLTLYVQYGQDVYASSRTSVYDTFGAPEPVTQFDVILAEFPNARLQVVTADGLELYFYDSFRPGRIDGGLFSARREAVSAPFAEAVERMDIHYVYDDNPELPFVLNGIWMSADKRTIYGYTLVTYSLVKAERAQDSFSPGLIFGSDDASTYNVALTPDELTLYSGNRGIFRSQRADTSLPFETLEQVVDLGAMWTDPVWISPDDCELVLMAFDLGNHVEDPIEGATSNDGIFVARRPL